MSTSDATFFMSNDLLFYFDDDGSPKRKGTLLSASAYIIAVTIGTGVLSLAWAVAQMGWISGPITLLVFAFVTWYASMLQADCYRNALTRKRHSTYREAVRCTLGETQSKFCVLAQYSNFIGLSIGQTIIASISIGTVKRAICFHKEGQASICHTEDYSFMIIFGILQLLLSQLKNFHKLSVLSYVAVIMSFCYSIIMIGLSIAKVAGGSHARTTLTGVEVGMDVTRVEKVWNILIALGNMAFAYGFSIVLTEIQDTIKQSSLENVVMKKAISIGISFSTFLYMLCGILGYAAYGNGAPGNLLSEFGLYKPYWLVSVANVFIIVHLIAAYQILAQPIFEFVESECTRKWPKSKFIRNEYTIIIPYFGFYNMNFFRLTWRTVYVITMTVTAMLLPFFNDISGLIGALSFWPLTIYFPIEMYMVQSQLHRFSWTGVWLQIVSYSCLIVSLLAAFSSVRGIVLNLALYKPFYSVT